MNKKLFFLALTLISWCSIEPRIGAKHFVFRNGVAYAPSLPSHVPMQKSVPSNRPFATHVKKGAHSSAYFSPDDDIKQKLIDLIENEQEAIYIAIFNFTERKLAEALCRAQKRGVDVQVVVDPSCLAMKANKVGQLCRACIPVHVYNAENTQSGWTSLMHHKFAIFKNNTYGSCVATGSFNWTKAASSGNQENLLIIEDPRIVARYENQFEKLKSRSQENRSGQ